MMIAGLGQRDHLVPCGTLGLSWPGVYLGEQTWNERPELFN